MKKPLLGKFQDFLKQIRTVMVHASTLNQHKSLATTTGAKTVERSICTIMDKTGKKIKFIGAKKHLQKSALAFIKYASHCLFLIKFKNHHLAH